MLERYDQIVFRGEFNRWGKFCVAFALYSKIKEVHTYFEIDFDTKEKQVSFTKLIDYWDDKQELTEEIVEAFKGGELNEIITKDRSNLLLLQKERFS